MFYYNQYMMEAQSLDEAYELISEKTEFWVGCMLGSKMKNKTLGMANQFVRFGT